MCVQDFKVSDSKFDSSCLADRLLDRIAVVQRRLISSWGWFREDLKVLWVAQAILVSRLIGSLHCCACTDSATASTRFDSMLLSLVVPSLPPTILLSAIAASYSTILDTSTPCPIQNFRLRVSTVPLSTFTSEPHLSIWYVISFSASLPSPILPHFTTQPTRKGSRQESPNIVTHAYFQSSF